MHLHQITDDDLGTLEAEMPQLMSASYELCNDPLTRRRWEAVRDVITRVRWNYGPPVQVKTEPPEDSCQSPL